MWTTTSGLSGRPLRVSITIAAVMGFSLFGYNQGMMAGLLNGDEFVNSFPILEMPKDATAAQEHYINVIRGAVTSCYELGCFFGALFSMFFGNKLGRTCLIFTGASVLIAGALLTTVCFTGKWEVGQFVIGRVVSGIGNGMNTATIPVWQSECSGAHNRGFLVCFEGAMIAGGTFIAYWVVFGLSHAQDTVQWRFPIALQILFAIIVAAGALMLPDSPSWFVSRGYDKEACEVLAKLNGVAPDSDKVLNDYNFLKQDVESSKTTESSWRTVFTFGKTQEFQRLLIGCSGQFFQQFTGCNAAIYYSTLLFQENLHMEKNLSLIMGGVFATVYAIATIPSFFMIERVGRRNLYLIGFLGQGLSFVITFACLIKENEANSKGAAVGIFLFITFFAFTLLPLPWIYPPEINPLRTRTVGAAASTCTNWICNFAVVMFTPLFSGQSSWGVYLFFALFNFIGLIFGFFFYVETAGRELEEVDIIYAKAHVQGKMPFRVAQEMPKLNLQQILHESRELGLSTDINSHSSPEKSELGLGLSGDSGQEIEEIKEKQ
ncbi:Major facilitator superfamily domain general substrate transporter [Penicillium cf. griseofulvum]|uniref:Major facilitator superfamily domain general substrate transporter n=1 Tax=Penicillium cf. griseofulvum TaxID=2972120 RepID=A0A9W9M5K4_9EURO|nr:Major facilitator superfamily domain general substrate transporter [Penicillium cf. griseofulvum]KAJ5422962.1 Major facilitator superfamily domain general substrate transporter [Penicillium cf. griseofulvum]KAJ5433822.1 Major facilitator superfamily domain general substrate transporter [Penicillium cf. griseofulvum]